MAKTRELKNGFNRGIISDLGLARIDLERYPLSSEIQNNFIPRVLGSQMLRPGWEYIDSSYNNAVAYHVPFVFSRSDTAIIELSATKMRVRVSEDIITRASVSTAVTSGDFSSATGWTDADESGATSTISGGILSLVGTRFNAAIRRQQVTVAAPDQNIAHALNITVTLGPVTLKVGSSSGGDQYIAETQLGTGYHSLAFTPTGDFHIEFSGRTEYATKVDSCTVASSGAMELTAPWAEADLPLVRWKQSGDVIYLACDGYQQKKIERRATNSWSIVTYEPEDGPFLSPNITTIRMSPSALTGNITLTASRAFFTSSNVGSLIRITSIGQTVNFSASGAAQWSDPIRVSGATSAVRSFSITITGTWTATVTLQRSVGEVGSWVDVTTYSGNTSTTYEDGLDNQIIYYRIGIDTGDYTSGTAVLALSYSSGGITGICRVTEYSSATSVSAIVLTALGSTSASETWDEGAWSPRRGYPSAVGLDGGRLVWAGKGKRWLSVSDQYEGFDDETEGDSGPISGFIGSGSNDTVNWIESVKRLVFGTDSAEWVARSSSLDEPLTPTNFSIKDPSTQGSAAVPAVKADNFIMFVHASGVRLFQIKHSLEAEDMKSDDMTKLVPEIAEVGINRIAVQRQPDTRIICVLEDGTLAVLVFDELENVKCWVTASTDGEVEDVFTLPGTTEDYVYYLVKRTINGSTKRYLEKSAFESECQGGTLNKQADSFLIYSGASTATITGLSHLEGEAVIAWGNGDDLSPDDSNGVQATYTVSSGSITLPTAVTSAVIGLPYSARYKSAKIGTSIEGALLQPKIVNRVGLLLKNTHPLAVKYGPDFDNLDNMPLTEDGTDLNTDTIHAHYDEETFEFDGMWDSDSRICLEVKAPRPATILAYVIDVTVHEK